MMTVMEDAIMEVDITVLMDAAVAHTFNFCINSKKINFALFVLRVLIFCIHFKRQLFLTVGTRSYLCCII